MTVRYPNLINRCGQSAINSWNRITQHGQIWSRKLDAENPLLQLVMSCALIALHTLTSSVQQKLFLFGCALSASCQLIMNLADIDISDDIPLQDGLSSAATLAALHIFLRKPGPLREIGNGFIMTTLLLNLSKDIAYLGIAIFNKIFHTPLKRARF